MRFFLDNNLSPRYARALDELEGSRGHEVVHLKSKYDQTTPDEAWMSGLGREGNWIVITSDYRITKNPHEIAAWKESKLTVFFLRTSWFDITFWEQAAKLVKLWPAIVAASERTPQSTQYIVPVSGTKLVTF